MMNRMYLTITFLWIVLGTLAIDVALYKTDNSCEGDDIDFCVDIAAGACCGSLDRLYQSCEAGIQAYSSRPSTGDICQNLLGGSFECWGISNDINAISGCSWSADSLQRIRHRRRTNSQEHNGGSNATEGCTEPTYHGRKIQGKKYGIDVSQPKFKEYENLTKEEEKNKFLIKNADIVRDM
jgi:hypothetical protein